MTYTLKEIKIAEEKIHHIKQRCSRKGLDFDISLSDMLNFLSVPTCELTGVDLITQSPDTSRSKFNVRTLDRRDNKKGYVTDNIMVICYSANKMKAKFEDPNNKGFVLGSVQEIIDHVKNKLTKEFKIQKHI